MKKRALCIFLVLGLTLGSLSIAIAQTTTVGNNSYIRLAIGFEPPQNQAEIVLNALYKFEAQNPSFEILNWVFHGTIFSQGGYVHGIWVHHRPRQK